MAQEVDIVIIGAGAAGIGAARRLEGSGLDVILVEALPRLGGRAWTLQAAGVPLDMGCSYLHSAERNPWTRIAEDKGFEIDRRSPAWATTQDRPGFTAADHAAAHAAFDRWSARIHATPPKSDCAADLLDPADARWTPHIQAISGYLNGDELERISVRDYASYDAATSGNNWRLPLGHGALVASCLPEDAQVHLDTPVEAVSLTARGVAAQTPRGKIAARAAVLTVSTNVLSGSAISLPADLTPWQEAAGKLPLGNDEKLYFEIVGTNFFEPETHFHGDPARAATGAYYVSPHDRPVVECFLGGEGARIAAAEGAEAAFARAEDELAALFGAEVRRHLKALVATDWSGTAPIGGSYSHALPGEAEARAVLAQPFEDRVFFAGEATHPFDFSTAHGALISGERAAEEAISALK